MASYAISDIHGCYDEFRELLELIGFGKGDELYILGDLVDRGPRSDAMIEWLCQSGANSPGSNVRYLLGNHEEMMSWSFIGRWSDFELDEICAPGWMLNGGDATYAQMHRLGTSTVNAFQDMVEAAPRALTANIEGRGRPIILCHGGIRPAEPECEDAEWMFQSEEDLLWIGGEWYCSRDDGPYHVVSGHVPTCLLASSPDSLSCGSDVLLEGARGRVMSWGHKHDIDCGCCFGWNLGALRLDDWEAFHVPSRNPMRS